MSYDHTLSYILPVAFIIDLTSSQSAEHDELPPYHSCNVQGFASREPTRSDIIVQFETYEQGQRVRASIPGALVLEQLTVDVKGLRMSEDTVLLSILGDRTCVCGKVRITCQITRIHHNLRAVCKALV